MAAAPQQGVAFDLLQAKQAMSSRLLKAGLRGHVLARRAALTVAAAVADAPRNVHAVGIGRKIVNGSVTAERCVRFYVLQKLASSLLPAAYQLPKSVDGIATDVVESAPAFLAARRRNATAPAGAVVSAAACTDNRRTRQVPRVAGISAAHHQVTAGTIAYFCRSTAHGDNPADFFVLSNNHVFANVNRAARNDDLLQPGPADGGTSADHFAELHRFVPITLGGEVGNKVDAAIGRMLPGTTFSPQICTIGRVTGVELAQDQMPVRKHGRTTGLTHGVVSDTSYDALVGMDQNDPTLVALFENQIRIEVAPPFPAFGLSGDSGSLVVTQNGTNGVGLYFAGPPSGDYGIANFIGDVLAELEIELL